MSSDDRPVDTTPGIAPTRRHLLRVLAGLGIGTTVFQRALAAGRGAGVKEGGGEGEIAAVNRPHSDSPKILAPRRTVPTGCLHRAERVGWQFLPVMLAWHRKETIVPTRNINRTEHWDDFIERQVASGRYSNASEIVRESLRLLEEQEQERKAKLKALRQAAKEGFDELDRGQGIVLEGKKSQPDAAALCNFIPAQSPSARPAGRTPPADRCRGNKRSPASPGPARPPRWPAGRR